MIVGQDGPAVVVPARIAAILERHADLTALRVRVRGRDPEASAVLTELRVAALAWRGSAIGTEDAPTAELDARSEWLSTRQAAELLGVTSRAIRKAVAREAIPATKVGRSLRISREDTEHYRRARAGRSN